MAMSPYTAASSHRISAPPRSCSIHLGSTPKSPGFFGAGVLRSSTDFRAKNYKRLRCRRIASRALRIVNMPLGTPLVPYKGPGEGTLQWIDVWNALYRERIIFIGEEITTHYSNVVMGTMLYLDSEDNTKKLYMYIYAPGGEIQPCLAIYDTMHCLKCPIATQAMGYTYNLSAFILAAGDKGQRFSLPRARIIIDPPAGSYRGQADDIHNEAKELLRLKDYLFSELASKTGQTVERISNDLRRSVRFSPEEALEYGLIDHIVKPNRPDPSPKNSSAGLG